MFGLSYLFRDVCSIMKGALFARDTSTGSKSSSPSSDSLSTSMSDSLDTIALVSADVNSISSSRLLDLPAELRNRIWAFAVSRPYRITIKEVCPLAQTSRQLRLEVLPLFFDHNTCILSGTSELSRWLPCQQASQPLLDKIHIDLNSSAAFGWTIQSYGLQPLKILDERVVPYEGPVVVWVPTERGMELLAQESRRTTFMSTGQLLEEMKKQK